MSALRTFASALAAVLVLAACGSGDDGGAGDADQQAARGPVELTGGTTRLALDPATDGLLSVAGVNVAAAGAARERDGAFVLPVTGGEVDVDARTGTVNHDGGLALETSGRGIVIEDLVVDLGKNVVTGTVGRREMPILEIDPQSGTAARNGGTVTVRDLDVSMTARAAKLVSERAGVEGPLGGQLVEEGQAIGTLDVEAQAR